MNGQSDQYIGTELDLFKAAGNWKRYWASRIKPYVGVNVLEVGAGIGANTEYLASGAKRWLCIEPDARLAGQIADRLARAELPPACRVFVGRLADLPRDPPVDTILYADVLEHIEDDVAEVVDAAARLQPGGHLIMVGPAHQCLMSPFDAAVGHHRRYVEADVRRLTVAGLRRVASFYLDSVGATASFANRFALSQATPHPSQVWLWDRVMVPLSRVTDALLNYRFGKSIVAIWQRA
jgi:protein-L-isoaspartate O-methyltransferase